MALLVWGLVDPKPATITPILKQHKEALVDLISGILARLKGQNKKP